MKKKIILGNILVLSGVTTSVLSCGAKTPLKQDDIKKILINNQVKDQQIEVYHSYFDDHNKSDLSILFSGSLAKKIVTKSTELEYKVKNIDSNVNDGSLDIEIHGKYNGVKWNQELKYNNLYKYANKVSELPQKVKNKYFKYFNDDDKQLFSRFLRNKEHWGNGVAEDWVDTRIKVHEIGNDFQIPTQFQEIPSDFFQNKIFKSKLVIPDSINIIEKEAFAGSTFENGISFPKNINNIGEAIFKGAKIEGQINLGNMTEIPDNFFKKANISNAKINFSKITKIGDYSFDNAFLPSDFALENTIDFGLGSLAGTTIPESFHLPNTLTLIAHELFKGAVLPKNFQLPLNVKKIGIDAFKNAVLPKNFQLPPSLEIISGGSFRNVVLPKKFRLPHSIKRISNEAFNGATIYFSLNQNNKLVEIDEGAFRYANILSDFQLPNSLTEIPHWAFAYARFTTPLKLPNTINTFGWNVFRGANLTNGIKLPSNIKELPVTMFWGAKLPKDFSLPDSLEKLGFWSLAKTNLPDFIKLPKNLKVVNEFAFEGTTNKPAINKKNYSFDNKNIAKKLFTSIGNKAVPTVDDYH